MDELDPREAAALLDETTRRAQRQFDLRPPIVSLFAAVTVLIAYGAIWLSVRHQHPYTGPSGTALGVLYGWLAVWVVVFSLFYRRATRGIAGRSREQQAIDGAAFAAVWISVYIFQGALEHAGASKAIVYGIYPAVAPIIIVGGAAAAHAAARRNTRDAALALIAVVLASVAAYTGPSAVWAVMAVGLCALLLVYAALRLRARAA